MCTEAEHGLGRDNLSVKSMSLRLALAAGLAIGVAAVAGVFWAESLDGLPVTALLGVEESDDLEHPQAEQVVWSSRVFSGEAELTEADLAGRFTEGFAAGFTADQLNAQLDGLQAVFGAVAYVLLLRFG